MATQSNSELQGTSNVVKSLAQVYSKRVRRWYYEAIEAQKAEVNSPNHTIIYIPSSSNGVPLVSTVPQQ